MYTTKFVILSSTPKSMQTKMRLFIGIENHTRSQFDDKTNIEFIEEEKKKPKTTQTNTVIG